VSLLWRCKPTSPLQQLQDCDPAVLQYPDDKPGLLHHRSHLPTLPTWLDGGSRHATKPCLHSPHVRGCGSRSTHWRDRPRGLKGASTKPAARGTCQLNYLTAGHFTATSDMQQKGLRSRYNKAQQCSLRVPVMGQPPRAQPKLACLTAPFHPSSHGGCCRHFPLSQPQPLPLLQHPHQPPTLTAPPPTPLRALPLVLR
jgi:hypothetical protein